MSISATGTVKPAAGDRLLIPAVFIVAFASPIVMHWNSILDYDVSYFLMGGRLINSGHVLYQDILDHNLPAAFLLGRVSDALSRVTFLAADRAHLIVLSAFLALSASLAAAQILRTPAFPRWAARLLVVVLALLVPFLTSDFGRREHLAAAGLLPWALAVVLAGSEQEHPARLWETLLIAIVASFAVFLKPHFLAFAITLAGLDLIRARFRLRGLSTVTLASLALTGLLYSCFLVLVPEYAAKILPATVETYGRYQHGWPHAFAILAFQPPARAPWLLGLLVIAYLLLRPRGAIGRSDFAALAVCAIAMTALAVTGVQRLFFAYHFIPYQAALLVGSALLLVWAALRVVRCNWQIRARALVSVVLVGFVIVKICTPIAGTLLNPRDRAELIDSPLFMALRPEGPDDALFFLSTSVIPVTNIFPLHDLLWSGHLISYPAIPALIRQDGRYGIDNPLPESRRLALERDFRDRVLAAFEANPPAVAAVDVTPRLRFFDHPGFDMLRWLRDDPGFDAAWRRTGLDTAGPPMAHWGRFYQIYKVKAGK